MGASEREIRAAAEVLLTGSSSSHFYRQTSPYLHSSCIHNEDVYVGLVRNNQMSVVRRFFCLFVTFDLLLTLLMWLMCMMLVSGGDILASFTSQVVHYNVHTSLFDIVMAASSRFTILLLFYALLHINHWSAVAITTAGTCVFLVAKVFVFDWTKASQPTFQVMLILVSFVLAWGEAWFLDFRVLPQEMKAKDCLLSSTLHEESDRNPLVRSYINDLPGSRDNPESVANFYSPLDSPQDSDDEGNPVNSRNLGPSGFRNQTEDYQRQALEVLDSAWTLINSSDWRLEKETAEGDTVHSKPMNNGPKVFRLTSRVQIPPRVLLNYLFDRIEDMPSWNPTVIESRRVQVIDEQTDITYQASAAGGGGVVSSRDFVILRHWGQRDNAYVSASASIIHPKEPPHKKYIRGESLPCCWVMRPVPGESNWCVFQWLLNTNLNGWLPQYVVDSAITTAMLDFLGNLQKLAGNLHQGGGQSS